MHALINCTMYNYIQKHPLNIIITIKTNFLPLMILCTGENQ